VPHILAGLLTILFRFPRLSQEQREIRVQVWSREMLARLGVRLVVKGTPATRGPVLLVANHISWLDITSLHAARYCRFVSKADVKGWPLIGMLASGVGTLFIERESRRDAMRVVHHMADSLRAGDVVAVFPEGTTSDGVHLLPFHANLLQAAIATEAPVQPVVLSYRDAMSAVSQAPSYVGDTSLAASMWTTVMADRLVARVVVENAQGSRHADRRALAEHLRETILGRLQEDRA
jgi:1-acyl-sn-glycerol-3-phosphate acyltransferase